MAMRYLALDAQFEKCEQHLKDTLTANTEVEFYLSQFLLVRVCAEFESRIKLLIERRCARTNDTYIKRFVQKSARRVWRDFKISDIKGNLEHFGQDYAESFRQLIDAPLEASWNNVYTNRHAVAHGAGTQMSLRELKETYRKSQDVLEAVVLALALRPRELKNL
jgi:RiboL-PSP-HEPN